MVLSYFPGNFFVGTATKHQCRFLVIPWLKGNILSCGKGRCYASSLPVRYIPKKSSKGKENNAVYLRGKEERNEVDLLRSSGQRYHESKNHTPPHNVNKNHEARGDFTTLDDGCVEEPDGSSEGVSQVDADNAIKLVFSEGEEEEDRNVGVDMSKLSMDQLYAQVLKQWNRSENAPNETRKSRIVRWLQYRGFNWSIVKYVLNKLESA